MASKTKQKFGVYKLGVLFYEQARPGIIYFKSKPQQDINGAAIGRFMHLVTAKAEWIGKVKWAAIYQDTQKIREFKGTTQRWETV